MKKLICFLILLSPFAEACDITKEYRDARNHIYKASRYAHNACIHSVNEYHYWQEVAKCEQEGLNKDISGGCQHVIANRVSQVELNYDHCLQFEVNRDVFAKHLDDYVKSNNIIKCSPPGVDLE